MSNLPIREAGAVFAVGLAFFLIQTILADARVIPMDMLPLLIVSAVLWVIDAILMSRRDKEEKALYRSIVALGEEMLAGSPLETAVYHAAQRGGSEGKYFNRVLIDAQGSTLSEAFHKASREATNAEAAEASYLLSLVAWSPKTSGSVVRWMGTYLEKIQLAEEDMKVSLAGQMITFRAMGIAVVPFVSAMLANSLATTGRFDYEISPLPTAALYYFIFVSITLAFVEGVVFKEWLRAPYKVPAYLCVVHACTFWV